jgi:hypothetical protein
VCVAPTDAYKLLSGCLSNDTYALRKELKTPVRKSKRTVFEATIWRNSTNP